LKKIIFVFLISILSLNSYARCNPGLFFVDISRQEFSKKLGEDLYPPSDSREVVDEEIFVPGELVCNNEEAFEGAPVYFRMIDGKVFQLEISKSSDKPLLISWVESIYGKNNNKPQEFFNKKPRAKFHWDLPKLFVVYSIYPGPIDRLIEKVIIQSKTHDAKGMQSVNEGVPNE